MTRSDRQSLILALIVIMLAAAAVVWSARSTPQLGDEERVVSRLRVVSDPVTTVSVATVACDDRCQLDTWQRAVWQVAVWEQATATTTTAAPEVEIGEPAVATNPSAGWHDQCPDDIEQIIRTVFAGTGREGWAVAIAWRESNCRPDVVSGEGALGLMQLLGHDDLIAAAGGDWSDPWVNARAARMLYDQCSTGPWEPPYWCSAP